MLENNSLVSSLEALLFVAGEEGVSFNKLTKLLGCDSNNLERSLTDLTSKYQNDLDSALMIKETNNCYRIVTKPEFYSVLENYINVKREIELNASSLEVLSIIAYMQPITRIKIEEIRGVPSARILKKLMDIGFIYKSGQADEIGKPILYSTTTAFLDYFNISDIKELPNLKQHHDKKDNYLF